METMNPQLNVRIRALLNEIRRSRREPVLSLEELAVAVVCVQPNLTLVELQRHILTAFKFYNDASVESSITRGYQGSIVISNFNTTFATLLRRFDLPFEVLYAESDAENEAQVDDEDELYVNPTAAQIFLQKHLASRKDGKEYDDKDKRPFPFLKLPCELRLQIYGHCLGLPKSGVSVRQANRYSREKEVVVRTKNFDAELQIFDWEEAAAPAGVRARWDNFEFRNRHDGTLKCQGLHTHLTLLSVNKEIYNEAMPVFYSINSFICSDLLHLECFLATIAPKRREQLRHICFFYTKTTHSKAAKAFKILGEIGKLKRLDIVIDEADFVGLTKTRGERMFPDVLKLPGFHTLKSMRAVKTVQFHGKCDTIREALQSWVVDNEINAEKPKKKKATKKAKPRVAKTVKKFTPIAEDDELEEEEEEGEDSLSRDVTAEQSEVDEEDEQDLGQDATPISTLLSNHRFDAPPPSPNSPCIRSAMELRSPFRFKPGNLVSHLANRFQMQSPSLGQHDTSFAKFDDNLMAGGAELFDGTDEQQQGFRQINMTASLPVYSSIGSPMGYQPVPNIATRMRLQSAGQMGSWRPVKSRESGEEVWTQTVDHSQFSFKDTAGESSGMPYAAADGTLKMEDLLTDHDDYELPR